MYSLLIQLLKINKLIPLNIKHFPPNKKINLVTVVFIYFIVVNSLKRHLNIIPFKTRKSNLVFIDSFTEFLNDNNAIKSFFNF